MLHEESSRTRLKRLLDVINPFTITSECLYGLKIRDFPSHTEKSRARKALSVEA